MTTLAHETIERNRRLATVCLEHGANNFSKWRSGWMQAAIRLLAERKEKNFSLTSPSYRTHPSCLAAVPGRSSANKMQVGVQLCSRSRTLLAISCSDPNLDAKQQ